MTTLTRPLRFGIKTIPQLTTYDDILRVWREADDIAIFEHAWVFDHFYPIDEDDNSKPCLEGWTLLAALAAQTQRLRVGVMVTGNTYRHPAVLANMGATVDQISHGRLDFGLGAAWNEDEHAAYGIPLPPPGERIRRMGEACEVIRRLWTEPSVTFTGHYYQLDAAHCEPKPIQQPYPPFVIGGGGEQLTLRMVARYADIWNATATSTPPAEFARKNGVLDGHCAAIGRDPATIERSVQVMVNPTKPAAARDQLRDYINAGATHLVIYLRAPFAQGIAHLAAREIAEPLRQEFMGS